MTYVHKYIKQTYDKLNLHEYITAPLPSDIKSILMNKIQLCFI